MSKIVLEQLIRLNLCLNIPILINVLLNQPLICWYTPLYPALAKFLKRARQQPHLEGIYLPHQIYLSNLILPLQSLDRSKRTKNWRKLLKMVRRCEHWMMLRLFQNHPQYLSRVCNWKWPQSNHWSKSPLVPLHHYLPYRKNEQ